jgi:processive 1,2-diacylglycerol beta-glucosyltransferase
MSARVLILSASVGSGHVSAARAVAAAFAGVPGIGDVRHEDALDFANPAYRAATAEAFLRLTKSADLAHVLGWLYDYNDSPWRDDGMRILLERVSLASLEREIINYAPDIVVCTHYMPAGIIAHLLVERSINALTATITTDYDFQGMWLVRRFHRYFVALDEMQAHLSALGVPPGRVTVSGIPVNAELGKPVDRAAVLAKYNLAPDKPVLIYSAGAAGGGPAKAIVEQLLQLRQPAQIVTICGRNAELRSEIEALVAPQAERFRVLGYTDDMPDLLRIATLFIGKPGGLSTAECMAAGLPMVIGSAIPGQEDRNSDHLLEHGAAICYHHLTVLAYKIDRLLADPEQLERMRAGARRMGRPNAAHVVAQTLLKDREDGLLPMDITAADRKYMEWAAREGDSSVKPPPGAVAQATLHDKRDGREVGIISASQLRLLATTLVDEHPNDRDYYINTATLDLLRRAGADAELLAMLAAVLDEHGEGEVVYRPMGEAQPIAE